MTDNKDPLTLLQLPNVVLRQILGYLCYDQIAQLRPVCKTFNEMCSSILNKGYYKMEKFHSESLKKVKAQLPRRESERRNHRLARHGDILMAIETRLSLLSMTYGKYIDQNLCCFIPGKVIDEVQRIIAMVINTDKEPPRPHEVLQELRDISSMAMEHFDECIQPRLRAKISGTISDPLIAAANLAIVEANDTVLGFRPGFRTNPSGSSSPHFTGSIYQTIADHNRRFARMDAKLKELEKKCKDKDRKLTEFTVRLRELEKQSSRTAELEKQLLEMRKMLRRDAEASTSRPAKFPADRNDDDFSEFQSPAKKAKLSDSDDNDL